MRRISFDRDQTIPVIDAGIRGPHGSNKIRLVFDTGCGLTQIDAGVIEYIGYSARDGERVINISGAAGETQQGYSVRIAGLSFFGRRFRDLLVGAMDFEHLSKQKIDGLLGWDIIKNPRLELNGPRGRLTVYSKRER